MNCLGAVGLGVGLISVVILMFVGGLREPSGSLCLDGTILHICICMYHECMY